MVWEPAYQVGGDTWSTYVRPSGSRLPFYVRRTLIGYSEEIQIWVDIFSLSGADLTGQCHSQFEMDRINICAIFLNHSGHSGSAWASPIPFQKKRIDSPRIKVVCFSPLYVKMHTVSNKIKNCQYREICWCVSHFRSKGFAVCAWRYRFFCHEFCRR